MPVSFHASQIVADTMTDLCSGMHSRSHSSERRATTGGQMASMTAKESRMEVEISCKQHDQKRPKSEMEDL